MPPAEFRSDLEPVIVLQYLVPVAPTAVGDCLQAYVADTTEEIMTAPESVQLAQMFRNAT